MFREEKMSKLNWIVEYWNDATADYPMKAECEDENDANTFLSVMEYAGFQGRVISRLAEANEH